MKTAKPIDSIDRKKNHTNRKELDLREQAENDLVSVGRTLICPRHLTTEAKKEWKRVVEIDNMRKKPIICDADMGMLQALCEYRAGWHAAQKEWGKDQRPIWTIKTSTGEDRYVPNPNLVLMDRYAKGMKTLYAAFFMTPQGRAQFAALSAKGDNGSADGDDDDYFD